MILHAVLSSGLGAALGLGYYKIVGCRSGACPITSNPYVSMVYGAIMGLMMGSAR